MLCYIMILYIILCNILLYYILDRSWIDPGSILDRSWIDPGSILDRSWTILDRCWIDPGPWAHGPMGPPHSAITQRVALIQTYIKYSEHIVTYTKIYYIVLYYIRRPLQGSQACETVPRVLFSAELFQESRLGPRLCSASLAPRRPQLAMKPIICGLN